MRFGPPIPLRSSLLLTGAGRSGGGAAAWTPMAIGSLTQWADIATLAGTSDNSPVGLWATRQGLALESTSTTRPTFAADDGDGFAALVFDGVDDYLANTADGAARGTFFAENKGETWFVLKPLSMASYQGYGFYGSVQNAFCMYCGEADKIFFDAPNYDNSRTTATIPGGWLNNWHVVRLVWDVATRKIIVDGATLATSTAGTTTIPATAIGARLGEASGAGYANCRLRDVLTFADALSDDDAALTLAYLEGKFGL